MSTLRYLTPLVIVLGACVAAWAETPDVDTIETNLEQRDARVQEISDQLDAGEVTDALLDTHLETLLGYQDALRSDARALTADLEEPTQRLSDLGPAPAENQPPESAEIAELRKSLSEQVTRLTSLSKEVELSRASVDRLIGRVSRAQASRFRASVTQRSLSPFSPALWIEASAAIASAVDRLSDHVADWWREQRASGNRATNLALLVAALAGAFLLLMLPRWSRWRELEARLDADASPSDLVKRRRTAERMTSRGFLTAAAGAVLYKAAVDAGLVELTGRSFALRLWLAAVALVVVWHWAKGVFSPAQPDWRIAPVNSRSARILRALFVAIFGLLVIDRVLAAGFALVEPELELQLAQAALGNTLFAVLLWLSLDPKHWHAEHPPASDATGEPVKASGKRPYNVPRSAGRLLAVMILVANALAYIRLSNFVFHRSVLLATLLILLWSLRVVSVWGLSRLPAAKPVGGEGPRADSESEEQQLDFWLNLALELTFLALAVPAFLLIVGFDWLHVRRWFGLLGTDIRIGAVSVSFTDILTAVIAFLLVTMGVKWTTLVVDKKLLQRTRLDAGERDSIMTLVNYAGVVVGILVALSLLGVGLSKIAIVAGALSVGIGFGLQAIVNNFVSGLILLFERPIKKGDWVVVDSGEGYVRHIGARATEVQTFDRSTILIPNSELVSSAVQNWFFKGRLGRMRVPVGVSYGSDPDQVRAILLDCAKRHAEVLAYPEPSVVWQDFGESSLDFELRFFVGNYDNAYRIRSELRFAIFAAFKDAGVEIPFPQRDLHIRQDGSTAPLPASQDKDMIKGGKGVESSSR